jgi:hypothetical protein
MMCLYLLAAQCEEYSARIIIGEGEEVTDYDSTRDMYYYIEGNLATGRIELCMNGVWSPVCQDVWTEADTSVACYQMGYSRFGMCIFHYYGASEATPATL